MEDGELRRIEKAAGVETINLDKVPPLLAAIGQVEARKGRPEGAIRTGDAPGRLGNALAGARRGHDYQAGLAAVLGRRRAADHFDGLNRVGRNLVGEDLALLVGDRLAIDRKRVGCVVAQTVKEAVRVGRHTGSGERDQRTERG